MNEQVPRGGEGGRGRRVEVTCCPSGVCAPGAPSRRTGVFLDTFRKSSSPAYLKVLEGPLRSGMWVSLGHPRPMSGRRCCQPAGRAREENRAFLTVLGSSTEPGRSSPKEPLLGPAF